MTGLRAATPTRIHRWSWYCPTTAETRSWCRHLRTFERAPSDNAEAKNVQSEPENKWVLSGSALAPASLAPRNRQPRYSRGENGISIRG